MARVSPFSKRQFSKCKSEWMSPYTRRDLPSGGKLRVLAGEVAGATGPVETTRPVTYAHLSLNGTETLTWSAPDSHTALVYVFGGGVRVNGVDAVDGQLVVLDRGGGDVQLEAPESDTPAELLLLAGEPINEPIARHGPFVMNTRAEILQAVEDYQAGRLGSIPPSGSGVQRS